MCPSAILTNCPSCWAAQVMLSTTCRRPVLITVTWSWSLMRLWKNNNKYLRHQCFFKTPITYFRKTDSAKSASETLNNSTNKDTQAIGNQCVSAWANWVQREENEKSYNKTNGKSYVDYSLYPRKLFEYEFTAEIVCAYPGGWTQVTAERTQDRCACVRACVRVSVCVRACVRAREFVFLRTMNWQYMEATVQMRRND